MGTCSSQTWFSCLKSGDTKGACLPPVPLGRPLNCEGAEKGRVIGRIDTTVVIRLVFEEPEVSEQPAPRDAAGNAAFRDLRRNKWGRGCHAVDIKFYMMDNLSDPMIMGYPEMSTLGCFVEPPDETGRRWMQLSQAGPGLRLPILMPEQKKSPQLMVVRSLQITGPNTEVAWLKLPAGDYQRAVE